MVLILESFQGLRTQFQRERLVMLRSNMFVTADGQNRLMLQNRRDVIYMPVCLHLEQAFETVLKEMKLDIDVLEETFAL